MFSVGYEHHNYPTALIFPLSYLNAFLMRSSSSVSSFSIQLHTLIRVSISFNSIMLICFVSLPIKYPYKQGTYVSLGTIEKGAPVGTGVK